MNGVGSKRGLVVGIVALFAAAELAASGLNVAAVQLSIPGDAVVAQAVFEQVVRRAIDQSFTGQSPDVIVFPEYTSVFPTLTPFAEAVEASDGVAEFYRRVTAAFPEIRRPVDAFALHRNDAEAYLDRFWGGLAREYRVDILAGSYFAVHTTGDGRLELRNRLLYYDRDGRRSYTQDKVYPTPFEYDFLGIRPGRLRAARPLEKEGVRIGISICNDTFYEAWEPHFREVDVWIDIKANNADFTDETRALFRRALPARISGAEGTIGITVCLGGTFLDLFWEGPSSIIEGASTGYRVLRRASSPELPEILIANLGL